VNRSRFPAVVDADQHGRVLADNAAGAQLPDVALDRMRNFQAYENAPKGGIFERAQATTDLVAAAKAAFAALIDQPVERVGIAPNATTGALAFSRLLASAVRPGDRIVVTDADHSANVEPWVWLERFGATIERIGVDQAGGLDEAALFAAFERAPFLVALPFCSNATGRRFDVARYARAAKAAGALVTVDGVQALPHIVIDVDPAIDFMTFSADKVYAPHIGFWAMSGAAHDRFVGVDDATVAGGIARVWTMETGTQNHAALAGWLGTIDYLGELAPTPRAAIGVLHDAEGRITRHALAAFAGRAERGVRLYGEGPAAERLPLFAFNVDGVAGETVARRLAAARIDARLGDFYCQRLMRTIAADAGGRAIRLSFAHYSTEADVDRCFEVVDAVLDERAAPAAAR
jgi:selenocysteine lyase/cysteine desulfurase